MYYAKLEHIVTIKQNKYFTESLRIFYSYLNIIIIYRRVCALCMLIHNA